jgi:hypothetical protein
MGARPGAHLQHGVFQILGRRSIQAGSATSGFVVAVNRSMRMSPFGCVVK